MIKYYLSGYAKVRKKTFYLVDIVKNTNITV